MEFDLSELFSSMGISLEECQYLDQLLNHRTILFNEEVDSNVIEKVYIPLKNFEEDTDTTPITLILNSPGGSLPDALFLCNVIDNYKKPLTILVPGYACSMATILLCAGNKNPNITKTCYPFSFGLLHSGQTSISGESTSVEDAMQFNKIIDEKIKKYILDNTKITAELYQEHHRKQWYFTAEELLEFGLVDKIIGADSDD